MKYIVMERGNGIRKSPSMRREWIEMTLLKKKWKEFVNVSLHAEGVD